MCRGSVLANDQEDAQRGVQYDISSAHHLGGNYRHGVLHRPDQGVVDDPEDTKSRAIACAACIRGQEIVTLFNLPPEIQKQFGVVPTAQALFISGDDEPDQQDKVEFEGDSKPLDLYDLADRGVGLCLGALVADEHPSAPAVRTLIAA